MNNIELDIKSNNSYNIKINDNNSKVCDELCDEKLNNIEKDIKLNKSYNLKINNNNIEILNNWQIKIRNTKCELKMFILNFQTLNQKNEINFLKKNFLKQYLIDLSPDFIFLIDIGKDNVNNLAIPNYTLFNNGRDILGMFINIKENVEIQADTFVLNNSKMCFTYIRPQETIKQRIELIKEKLDNNFTIIGDLNLKSNPSLKNKIISNNLSIKGEFTAQTIIVNDNDMSYLELIPAPSDHNLIFYKTTKNIMNVAKVKIEALNEEKTDEVIAQILKEGKYETDIEIKQIKQRPAINKEEIFNKGLLDSFLNSDTKSVFKYYDYMWKNLKREPFLGTYVNDNIKDSLFAFYNHNINKTYQSIDQTIEININDLEPRNSTFSNACNNEYLSLSKVDNAIKKTWYSLDDNEKNKAVKNLINLMNNTKENIIYKTFFLIKNKQLLSFNDVRIIVIVPTLIKIWENLIYNKVYNYLTDVINEFGVYQYGGMQNKSTYEAFWKLQKKYLDCKGEGVLYIDIAKGYDNLIFDILKKDILEIPDERVKNLLYIWFILIANGDVRVNNSRIKKGRGIAMGLALSPVIFNWYVHNALKKDGISIENLIMFIDDLAIVINKFYKDQIMKLKMAFKIRGLIINEKKSSFICNNEVIKRDLIKMGFNWVQFEKYLGKFIKLDKNGNIIPDNRFLLINNNVFALPKFTIFGIKRLIINGAIVARLRYALMMCSLKSRLEKYKTWKFLWTIFRSDFKKLSYIQLSFISMNIFRLCIDLNDLDEIKSKIKILRLTKDKKKCINYDLRNLVITGITDIDNIILNTNFDIDPDEIEPTLSNIKSITNKMWKVFKNNAIDYWIKKKKEEKIQINPKIKDLLKNKLVCNSKILLEIIFNHFDVSNANAIEFVDSVLMEIIDKNGKIESLILKKKLFGILNVHKLVEKIETVCDIYTLLNKEEKIKINLYLNIIDSILNSNGAKNFTINDYFNLFNLKLKMSNVEDYKLAEKICESITNDLCDIKDLNPSDNVLSVDGSFNTKTNTIGSGILIKSKTISYKESINIISDSFTGRNVWGEICALIKGLKIIKSLNWKHVNIVFDYMGLYAWACNIWKAKDPVSIKFKEAFKILSKNLNISWFKVKSHTNYELNEEADVLAKIGCGMCQGPFQSENLNDILNVQHLV